MTISRKRLVFYHVCFFGGMSGTLLAVAPPLAPPVIGFSVIYLAALTVLYVAGWVVGMRRRPTWSRVLAMALGCIVLWLGMTALGGPDAGVMALLLAVVSLWPRRPGPLVGRPKP